MRLRLAVITAAFCSAATAVYALAGVEPVPILGQQRHIAAVTDLGFFLMLFWPIAIPWYAFKSQGRGGWRLLLGLLAIVFAPALTGLILYWSRQS